MPLAWQDPEVALTHRGVSIYHTYKDQNAESKSTYWYSFSAAAGEHEFDVRSLPSLKGDNPKILLDPMNVLDHPKVIRAAIENGALVIPDEAKPLCEHANLIISSYQVGNANAPVSLARTVDTGEVMDFAFNRIDGEVGDPIFHCIDCGGEFEWKEVLGF